MTTKRSTGKLKLPEDFLGTVQAFLHTPPPKEKKAAKKPKAKKKRGKTGRG